MSPLSPAPQFAPLRLWGGYALAWTLALLLYALAGTDWQRGTRTLLEGLVDALATLGPGLLLGAAVWPWLRRELTAPWQTALRHALGALLFMAAWQALHTAAAAALFGGTHALASLEQGLVWRGVWACGVYGALALGFGAVRQGRAMQAARWRMAQAELQTAQAQAARVRAELAALQGKLDPHFLFNTLNTLLHLVRRDPARAETALLGFSRLMRYLLDRAHGEGPVTLGDELAFVRDYLALEQLRLGERLRVHWDVDPATAHEPLPPLTLQPLVENAILHGIAPRPQGGTLTLSAHRRAEGLRLRVADDGQGCHWPPPGRAGHGLGLAALQKRFELDFDGRGWLRIATAPGAGFTVDLCLP